MDIETFFSSLSPISDWLEIGAPGAYKDVPEDWWVLMTDIKGSTAAISSGKYKQVNILGVCAIISVQNAIEKKFFPFIFGGDGATLVLPENLKDRALEALSYTRKVAKNQFGFDLRVFSMSVKELRKQGKTISVARLETANKQNTFLFKGGGITQAEVMMKKDPQFELALNHRAMGSHEGLECRWNPVPSQKGSILSLIIKPLDEGGAIEAILFRLKDVVDSGKPINAKTIPVSWPPQDLKFENRAKEQSFLKYLGAMFLTLFLLPLILLGRKKKASAVDVYLKELESNTDFLKRDDTLRLVLDVSPEDKADIFSFLDQFKDRKLIEYGYHESQQAIMTCMVRGPHEHFHFIDGSDGGYVKAAQMLKNSNQKS